MFLGTHGYMPWLSDNSAMVILFSYPVVLIPFFIIGARIRKHHSAELHRRIKLAQDTHKIDLSGFAVHHDYLLRHPDLLEWDSLKEINLSNNDISRFPLTVTRLSKLERLDLSNNQLKSLPAELGSLPRLEELNVQGNPLTSLPSQIVKQGNAAILVYLKSIAKVTQQTQPAAVGTCEEKLLRDEQIQDTAHQEARNGPSGMQRMGSDGVTHNGPKCDLAVFEAKLVLCGEGGAGKTSLIHRLRTNDFVSRPTTHGIECGALHLPHPEIPKRTISFNSWDFGGQPVYRILHQFFFSNDAIYLLLWRAREGTELGNVRGWLRLIKRRIPQSARVILVATHANERRADFDYASLKDEFGDMLVGHAAVDSKSGSGISELKQLIAEQAAKLPDMGKEFSPFWLEARNEALALAHPQDGQPAKPRISFGEFEQICQNRKLEPDEAIVLAKLLHSLGRLVYWADADELSNTVILDAEWLTHAISYVLDDAVTAQKGILTRDRLPAIWGGRTAARSYAYKNFDFPVLLHLMQLYEVSFPFHENAWLVVQLVPFERPALPPHNANIKIRFDFPDGPPEGLIAALTVRHAPDCADDDRHFWRNGLFLGHPSRNAQALVELKRDALFLTASGIRGASFLNHLRESTERLLKTRWPGADFEVKIPCPNGQCKGSFRIDDLEENLNRSPAAQVICRTCRQGFGVLNLLLGLREAEENEALWGRLDAQFASLKEGQDKLLTGQERLFNTLWNHCPRLFTLEPLEPNWRDRFIGRRFKVDIWCEEQLAPVPGASVEITFEKEWLRFTTKYALPVARRLLEKSNLGAGAVAFLEQFISVFSDPAALKAAEDAGLTTGSLGQLSKRLGWAPESDVPAALAKLLRETAERAGMRRLVSNSDGSVRWVSAEVASRGVTS
jgi:GTPase SAR1 family protein